jgi:hypothetical protein
VSHNRWVLHGVFFFGWNVSNLFFPKARGVNRQSRGKRPCVLMLSKCGKGSVGEGEAGKKAKTTPDAGGKYVSEKFHTEEK